MLTLNMPSALTPVPPGNDQAVDKWKTAKESAGAQPPVGLPLTHRLYYDGDVVSYLNWKGAGSTLTMACSVS
jgi:hypothetical protein